ncbi:MAG TPA: universal stress protein [Candidatus Nanoarchaeia archaeon]|nr:universal stress protein [Candidatus Nanoarchaeia archaeon]
MNDPVKYNTIIVPVDETMSSRKAVKHALHIARLEGSKLILVHVSETAEVEKIFPKELSEKILKTLDDELYKLMDSVEILAQDLSIELEEDILDGEDIGGELIKFAKSRHSDLIVMGSELLRKDPIGSRTRRIIAADIGPVLVVTDED